MKTIFLFLGIVYCSFFCILLSAKNDLLELVSKDSAFLLEVDNITEFNEEIESGPLGEFMKSDAWEQIYQWMEDEWKKEISYKKEKKDLLMERIAEWVESFNGQALLAVGDVKQILSKEMPSLTLLMETDATQEKLEDTLRWIKKEVISLEGSFSWEREKIAGEVVHWIGPDNAKKKNQRLAVILFDKTFGIFTGGREHVKDILLGRSKNSDFESILNNNNYLDLFDEIERGSARTFFNFESLDEFMKEVESLPNPQIPENPFGINTSNLISALGLDSIECVGIQVDASEQSLTLSSGAYFNKYEGLFSFIQHDGDGEAVLYDFVPTQAFTVSCARYDFGKLWPTIEKIVSELSPQLLLLMNSQIQAFEDQAGVPFRQDVMGSFGDEMVSFSFLDVNAKTADDFENANPSIYAISLRDSELFDRSLRSMIEAFSSGHDLFEERVHKGVTIRKVRGIEASGISISYAVTEKWLLLGMADDAHMTQLINRLDGKGRSLWSNKQIKRALKAMPDGVRQIDYVNFDSLIRFLVPIVIDSIKDESDLKLRAQDFPKLPYFLLAWSKNVKRGIIGKGELFPIANKR
ncbi:MAG: hypothetical protein HN548_11575 [Opitutae bacterium]|jgi:hypothetical protein|nr:hypothetical protein [Opitutae bacterium]